MSNTKIKTTMKHLSDSTVTFNLLPYQRRWIEEFKDKDLTITISDRKDRSLQQNAKLWALIHEIDSKVNGYTSEQGEEEIYIQVLEQANISPDWLMITTEAVDSFRSMKAYRIVKEMETQNYKGKDMTLVKCYKGSSKFDTKEMSDFIEAILKYAWLENVNLEDYQDLRSNK